MDTQLITTLSKSFEDRKYEKDGVEFWLARDMQSLLDYAQWRNFEGVIEKAKQSCQNAGQDVKNHFADASKMVTIGSDTSREVEDIVLSRYACYLIAQNGDPRKDVIAFAQSYFAFQTRKQELIEERIQLLERLEAREKLSESEKQLSGIIYERGVDNSGFSRIRAKGDSALFGGHSTQTMKDKLGIAQNRPLADFLPTITIKAKDFATELTNFNIQKDNLHGENSIAGEHIKNNSAVRKTMMDRGIVPEKLPPEEDIKKLERRVKSEAKKLLQGKNLQGLSG